MSSGIALYAQGGASQAWSITNSGLISATAAAGVGIKLGSPNSLVGASIITNETGGTITGLNGIKLYGNTAISVTNAQGAIIDATSLSGDAISSNGAFNHITNFGTISAVDSTRTAIVLSSGGYVTDGASGVIFGEVFAQNGTTGSTIVDAGTIGLINFINTFANFLVIDPGAVLSQGAKVNPSTNHLSSVELATGASAGTLAGFNGTSITNFATLQFDADAEWTVSGTSGATGLGTIAIDGFTAHDTIDLTDFFANTYTFANNALVLTNTTSNAQTTLNINGTFAGFNITSDGGSGTDITVCFLAGTRIATPSGDVSVEDLAVGDPVRTLNGEAKPIVWIGKGKTLVTRGKRNAANPVIVRKNAIADNVPNRDLHVTKGHSLYFGEHDVLVPVEFLVNHRSIVWHDQAGELETYHVELASHEVLVANGAPAESYRDDGNRWVFQNANAGWDRPVNSPYAAVQTGGVAVDAIWHSLLERSGQRLNIPTTGEADLHLLVDGKRLDGRRVGEDVYTFRLPKRPISVRVASRAAAPDELGQSRDPRLLGVALREVKLWQGRHLTVVTADDPRWSEGVHPFEADHGFRWTDGNALLPTSLFEGVNGPVDLVLHVACFAQYEASNEQASMAA